MRHDGMSGGGSPGNGSGLQGGLPDAGSRDDGASSGVSPGQNGSASFSTGGAQ